MEALLKIQKDKENYLSSVLHNKNQSELKQSERALQSTIVHSIYEQSLISTSFALLISMKHVVFRRQKQAFSVLSCCNLQRQQCEILQQKLSKYDRLHQLSSLKMAHVLFNNFQFSLRISFNQIKRCSKIYRKLEKCCFVFQSITLRYGFSMLRRSLLQDCPRSDNLDALDISKIMKKQKNNEALRLNQGQARRIDEMRRNVEMKRLTLQALAKHIEQYEIEQQKQIGAMKLRLSKQEPMEDEVMELLLGKYMKKVYELESKLQTAYEIICQIQTGNRSNLAASVQNVKSALRPLNTSMSIN